MDETSEVKKRVSIKGELIVDEAVSELGFNTLLWHFVFGDGFGFVSSAVRVGSMVVGGTVEDIFTVLGLFEEAVGIEVLGKSHMV